MIGVQYMSLEKREKVSEKMRLAIKYKKKMGRTIKENKPVSKPMFIIREMLADMSKPKMHFFNNSDRSRDV